MEQVTGGRIAHWSDADLNALSCSGRITAEPRGWALSHSARNAAARGTNSRASSDSDVGLRAVEYMRMAGLQLWAVGDIRNFSSGSHLDRAWREMNNERDREFADHVSAAIFKSVADAQVVGRALLLPVYVARLRARGAGVRCSSQSAPGNRSWHSSPRRWAR
jgi:hypothetical protein